MTRLSQFDLVVDHSGQVPTMTRWRRTTLNVMHFSMIALAAMVAGLFVFPL